MKKQPIPNACNPAGMHSRALRRKAITTLSSFGVGRKAIASVMAYPIRSVYHVLRYWYGQTDLNDKPRSGRVRVYNDEVRLKVIAFYCQITPLPGCGRWTLSWAAIHLKANPALIGASPSKSTIHRILISNKLKPHLSRYFLHITDPDFFPKMEHLVNLYMNPPKYLFFFDECPGIQILKRISPDLRDEMMNCLQEFEYIRNGTTDVFAFLNHADGTVFAGCYKDHKTQTLIKVFEQHVSQFPYSEQLHYVMDNLSSHSSYTFCQLVAKLSGIKCPPEKVLNSRLKRVDWLKSPEKRIVIHYTPYHGSWLNLVEIWFGIMGKKFLNESFGSPLEIKAAFDHFVSQWNLLLAHPFKWNYTGDGLHEKAVKRFTSMLRDSAARMDIRFLTKSIMLMSNILKNYYSKVSETIWIEFEKIFWSQLPIITDIIVSEKGDRKSKKASDAIDAMITDLEKSMNQTIVIAA